MVVSDVSAPISTPGPCWRITFNSAMWRMSSTYWGSNNFCRMDGMRSVPPATIRRLLCFASSKTASSNARGRSSLNWGRLNRRLPLERPFRAAQDPAHAASVPCLYTTAIHRVRETFWVKKGRHLR